jgi:L-rhamnose mutarotase
MIRRAFTMRLKPGADELYRHHHDNVWPELVEEIERSGIASITTFQRGQDLFLVSEIADESAWDKLWTSEIHRRWAEVMEPLMHLRDDGIVDAGQLEEIFHLSTAVGQRGIKAGAKAAQKSAKKKSSAKSKTGSAREKKPAAPAKKQATSAKKTKKLGKPVKKAKARR